MKTPLGILFIVVMFSAANTLGQDWAKVNPEMNNILADTTLLRATIAVLEPGIKSESHTHPAFFFYALTDCKLNVYYENGHIETLDFKAGDYGYGSPEKPHQTENMGDKTAKFLMVELKEHPYIVSDNKNK